MASKNIKTVYGFLINNWEATYFDFDGKKILDIARQAAALGIEMFVLDDGWFGKRDSDNTGLGDWYVNEEKMEMSLTALSDQIHVISSVKSAHFLKTPALNTSKWI